MSNFLRILLSKVTNEVSNYKIECGSNPSSDRVPTVDDQPYCIEDLVMEIQNYIKYMWVLNSKTHRILLYLTCLETLSFHVSCKYPYY